MARIRPQVVADVPVNARPYRAGVSRDGNHVLVSLVGEDPAMNDGAVVVLSRPDDYTPVATLPMRGPSGFCVAGDDRRVFVAQKIGGLTILDRLALLDGQPSVIGTAQTSRNGGAGIVALTADERYAVTSEEAAAALTVIDVAAVEGDAGTTAVVGHVEVDLAPIAVVAAPDGRHLYVTCQAGRDSTPSRGRTPGTVLVIDVAAFEGGLGWGQPIPNAVVTRAEVGNAVRLALSHGGEIAWVTLRRENRLIALRASALRAGIADVLARVPTGPAPVGITTHADESLLLVANSNRFDNPDGHPQRLAVIDVETALAGDDSVVDHLAVGAFPRELVSGPNGEAVLTNFDSRTVSIIT